MNKRIIIAIVIALIITGVIILGIYSSVNNMTKPKETVDIAVATQEIKAGTLIKPEMYKYISIPKDEYIPSYITKEEVIIKNDKGESVKQIEDVLVGKEATQNIYKGERFIKARISGIGIDKDLLQNSNLRRMTYTAQGIQNLAGQLKAGDKIDFWLRYKLQDKENKDTIIVVDKILSNIPVAKAINSNSQEIKNNQEATTTIEILLTQEQIQEFIKWRDLGKITLVKVPADIEKNEEEVEITRKKMSMNELIWDVISMEENEMNKNDIVKDPNKKNEVKRYKVTKDESEEKNE